MVQTLPDKSDSPELKRFKSLWDAELIPLDLKPADARDITGDYFQSLVDVELLLETLEQGFDAENASLLRHRVPKLLRLQFFEGDDKTRRLRRPGYRTSVERELRNLMIGRRREFCQSMAQAIRYYHETFPNVPFHDGVESSDDAAHIGPTPQASEPFDTPAPAGWETPQGGEPGSAAAPNERETSFNPEACGGKELCIAVSYQKLKQRDLLILAKMLKNKANTRYENKHGDPVKWQQHGGFRKHIHRLRKKAQQEGWYDAIPPGYCISYATGNPVKKRLQQCLAECPRKAP